MDELVFNDASEIVKADFCEEMMVEPPKKMISEMYLLFFLLV